LGGEDVNILKEGRVEREYTGGDLGGWERNSLTAFYLFAA
jgi:hypothetical protein